MPRLKIRHSLAALLLVVAIGAPRLSAQAPGGVPQADITAMQEYKLGTATLAKLMAVQDNLYATLKAHPEVAKKVAARRAGATQPHSLDEVAAQFDQVPEVRQAIVKAGVSPREYTLMNMAVLQAVMVNAMLQTPGVSRDRIPPAVQANAEFIAGHPTEMQRFQARNREIELLTRAALGDSGDSASPPPGTSRR